MYLARSQKIAAFEKNVLRERFAEPSTRTPPASPMNNDGHVAALNRAVLMPLLS
jgi:hypothetical protein